MALGSRCVFYQKRYHTIGSRLKLQGCLLPYNPQLESRGSQHNITLHKLEKMVIIRIVSGSESSHLNDNKLHKRVTEK